MRGRTRITALAIAILDFVGIAALVASLAFAIAIGFLFKGPIAVDFLAPQLQSRLSSLFPTLALELSSVELRLDRTNGRLALSVRGLRIAGPQIGDQAVIDRLDVGLSPLPLIKGDIILDQITAEGAILHLVRSDTGRLALRSADPAAADPLSALAALLSQFDHAASRLPAFSLTNSRLLLPSTASATPAELLLHRVETTIRNNRIAVTVDAALPFAGQAGRLIAEATVEQGSSQAGFRASLRDLNPAIATHWLAKVPPWLPASVSGAVEGELSLATGHATGKFTIIAPDYDLTGSSRATLKIAGLQLAGRIDTAMPVLVLDSLYADVGAGRMTAAALLTDITDGPRVKINVNAQDLQIADLSGMIDNPITRSARGIITSLSLQFAGAVSPQGLQVDPRSVRFKSALSAGRADLGNATLSGIEATVTYADAAAALTLSQARFSYPDEPAIDNIAATGSMSPAADGQATIASFQIATASIQEVKIANGSVSATIDGPDYQFAADLPLAGSAQAVINAVSARIPSLRDLRQSARLEGGSISGRLKIAGGAPAGTQLSLDLDAKAVQATPADLPPITIETAKIRYADNRIEASGKIAVSGMRADIEIAQDRKNGGGEVALTATGEVSSQSLPPSLARLRSYLTGTVRHQIKLRHAAGAGTAIAIEVDLASAALEIAPIRWRKPARAPGSLKATVHRASNGAWRIDDLRLNAGDMDAAGTASLLADGTPHRVRLTRMRYGQSDGTSATVEYVSDGGQPARLTVAGERIDARPFIEEPSLIERPTAIDIRAGAMRLSETASVTNVTFRGAHDGAGWTSIAAEGQIPAGGAVRLQFDRGSSQGATIYADNAASFIALLAPDIGKDLLAGGELAITLDGNADLTDPAAVRTGRLALRQLIVNRPMPLPPSMGRVLSLADFSDLTRAGTTRITAAEARFTKSPGKVHVADLFAYTDTIAIMANGLLDTGQGNLSFSGEIAPYEIVQRLVAQVPFTGAFVSSADKSGLVSVPFTLSGPIAAPDFATESGLQAIQPGRLRDLVKAVSPPLDLSIDRRLPASSNR